jgi:hypothetical protein
MPTLTTNAALLRFAEDEYLSELMLRAMTRPTARCPKQVTFEWGQVLDEGTFQSYMATAEGVTRWSIDGAWDKTAVVELEFPNRKRGILLAQYVPGRLELACAKLTIERGKTKRYTLPAAIDPTDYLVWGPRTVTWTQLRSWLEVPAELSLYKQAPRGNVLIDPNTYGRVLVAPQFGRVRIQRTARSQPWIALSWDLSIGNVGHYFSVQRGTCDEAAWARALRLPQYLGPSTILSGTVRCTSAVWLRKWVPT